MLITTTLLAALSLSSQTAEGSFVSSQGCVSAITGQNTTIVSTNVGTYRNNANATPKQGDVFYVYINILAFPQPCATSLMVRPGFKLPEGVEFVEPAGFNSPVATCRMGTPGNPQTQGCMLEPTEILFDGTMIFDRPNGLWFIPDGQMLQIAIPVRGTEAALRTLRGYVDFGSFDFDRAPLEPTVGMQIYFKAPLIGAPTPAVIDVTPYSAHLFGYVDTFNAGTLRVELSKNGGAFTAIEEAYLDAASFENDVDVGLDNLDPDTDYQARWTFQVDGMSQVFAGAAHSFRTLPAPRHRVTFSVEGDGAIARSLQPDSDGTYLDRSVVTFSAAPASGHRLVSFSVNGVPMNGSSTTVTITQALDVRAVFAAIANDAPAQETEDEQAEHNDEPAQDEQAQQPEQDEPVEEDTSTGINVEAPRQSTAEVEENAWTSDEPASGGCAAAPSAGLPVFVLVMLLRRRR